MAKHEVTLISGLGITVSGSQVMDYLKEKPERVEALKQNPIEELPKIISEAANETPAYIGDKFLYRMVAFALGLVILLAAIGAIVLALLGKTTPDLLVALGSGAIGALAGYLPLREKVNLRLLLVRSVLNCH